MVILVGTSGFVRGRGGYLQRLKSPSEGDRIGCWGVVEIEGGGEWVFLSRSRFSLRKTTC